MDTLFSGVTAVMTDEDCGILENACVLVSGGKIVSVSPARPAAFSGREIDGTHKVLLPALTNAHTHVPMTLLRGYADGYDLQTWLNDYIFPAEARLDGRAVRAGAALAAAELLAGGTGSVSDMYYFCDDIVTTLVSAGLCANIARGATHFGGDFDPETHPACIELRELYDRWHNRNDGQIKIDACIHGEYTSDDRLWRYIAGFGREHGLGMHVHLSETRAEHEACLARHGKTPAAVFEDAGVWLPGSIAAHCVWVSDEDIALLCARGVTAVHNPISNLKLGSGVAPVPKLLRAGVNVALGTDGASSNNAEDMFGEIRAAALIHNGVNLDPTALSARDVLKMATVNGAKAQRRNSGVVRAGMEANLILVDFDKPHLTPCHSVVSNLVYAARGSDVCLTMVRGNVLYENGAWLTIDMEKVNWELSHYAVPKILGQ
ncbi:MAG TPA: amidohydrolase [Oscillospiraceae bacterium]|nr:amidohydrolase [Oscillospiraceae bacterium]